MHQRFDNLCGIHISLIKVTLVSILLIKMMNIFPDTTKNLGRTDARDYERTNESSPRKEIV